MNFLFVVRFEQVSYKDVDYRQELATFPSEDHDYMEYLQLQWIGNVAQFLALKFKGGNDSHYVIVSNTHSYYRWDHSYTRLRQNKFLLEQAILFNEHVCKTIHQQQQLQQTQQSLPTIQHIPIISCGDFNISPDAVNYTTLVKRREFMNSSEIYDEYKNIPASFFDDMQTTILEYYGPIVDQLAAQEVEQAASQEATKEQPQPIVVVEQTQPQEQQPTQQTQQQDNAQDAERKLKLIKVKQYASQKRQEQVFKIMQKMHKTLPYLHSVYSNHSQLAKNPQSDLTLHLWQNEPPYTNYVDTFKSTLDFIFVYKTMHKVEEQQEEIPILTNQLNEGIFPLRIVEVPKLEQLEPVGIPSDKFASDHIPIMCEFAIAPLQISKQ